MSEVFDIPNAVALAKSITALCDAGHFGYARLDSNYRAIWRYGELASWIPFGENVCQHTELLFGLDKELLDLQDENWSCFALPRVGLPTHAEDDTKISVEIYWEEPVSLYHVIIHKLVADAEVEMELLKQIRARRLAEQNFQTARERLAGRQMLLDILMRHLPVGAAIFDEQRRYLFATRRWASDLQMECEPLMGRDCFDAGQQIPESERRNMEMAYAGAVVPSEISAATLTDGQTRWRRWTHKAWTDGDGARGGVLTSAEDVTGIVARQKELEIGNERLALANQQLLQFASILAHDLNAPLRALQTTVEELKAGGASSADAEKALKHISRMRSIIEALHEDAQTVRFAPELTSINVRNLIFEIVDTLPRGRSFQYEFRLAQDEIRVQKTLLDMVLRNLLDNAFKHHDKSKGRIVICLDEAEKAWLLSLEDDGPGMDAAQQAAILARSNRPLSAPRKNGSGLGLAIVRSALERIGGGMTIESDAPHRRGTRFTIHWPKPAEEG
jgi:signal transduction histidine kinase